MHVVVGMGDHLPTPNLDVTFHVTSSLVEGSFSSILVSRDHPEGDNKGGPTTNAQADKVGECVYSKCE